MIGQTLSHYRIVERLGGGGMGVVYKALDTKLNRHVALKLLPPAMTGDDELRQRFVQEAQAASALDHPNICTIHEVDATPDGRLFIVMGFYDGETLKKRIERGPLEVDEAMNVAIQIAQGLSEAHGAGIVHRDIKPANVMLTSRGLVKIVDFGVAKLLGVTGLTQTGSTVGTLSYMSPEQVEGDEADHRSDLWSLGVVLYEMLAGQRPFDGENHWAVMNAIGNVDPEPPSALREAIPLQLDRLISKALEKDPNSRFQSAHAFLAGVASAYPAGAGEPVETSVSQSLLRAKVAIPIASLLIAAGVLAVWTSRALANVRWARQEALPEVVRLVDENRDFRAAYALALEAERFIPDDPMLSELLGDVSAPVTIRTEPEGAEIRFREYGADSGEWTSVGRTPLVEARLPQGLFEWRIELDGYHPVVLAAPNPGVVLGNFRGLVNPDAPLRAISLLRSEAVPDGMVHVPGGSQAVALSGFGVDFVPLPPFLIDQHEVSNQQFKEFVDAGGYREPEYWEGLEFVRDGRPLSRAEAMAEFVDATGLAGPATWELGDYANGEEDLPVGGVSWYEAAAYAAFRGSALPTIYHWARAASTFDLHDAVIPRSNFEGAGPVPVGSSGALGSYGSFDAAGNVREWVLNRSGDQRWIPGGAWSDRPYMATFRRSLPPFDRSPLNGFRTVRYLEQGDPRPDLTAPVLIPLTDHRQETPASDELFASFVPQFEYDTSPLEARIEHTGEGDRSHLVERITFDAGYDGERTPLHLFLPRTGNPPYPTVVFFPGMTAFSNPGHSEETMASFPGPEEFVWKSGMALAWPVYDYSFERWEETPEGLSQAELSRYRVERMAHWREDLGRTIDYIATRDDLDSDRLVYMGFSYGASIGVPVLALEDRFRTAILISGGLAGSPASETYALHYLPRINTPTLMLAGSYDHLYPIETDQQPFFDHLGVPLSDKRFVEFDAGHWPLPRSEWVPEALAWLEQYLGPID